MDPKRPACDGKTGKWKQAKLSFLKKKSKLCRYNFAFFTPNVIGIKDMPLSSVFS